MKKIITLMTSALIFISPLSTNVFASEVEEYICPITLEAEMLFETEEVLNHISNYIIMENSRNPVSGSKGIFSWEMTNFSNSLIATGRSSGAIERISSEVYGNYSGTTRSETDYNINPAGSLTSAISARVTPRPAFRFSSADSYFSFRSDVHGSHSDSLHDTY